MNPNLVNSNSGTSTSTMGHSRERFQAPQIIRPINSVSATDLKSAADTVAGLFLIPPEWGAVQILKMGFHASAAGGAVTTPGTLKLTVGGQDVEDLDGNVMELPTVEDAPIYAPFEMSLNRTTRERNLVAEPDYPYATAEEGVQLRVGTQGSGAGAQTVFPYLIVRIHPENGVLYPR